MLDKEGPTHNAGDMFEIYCYNMQKKSFLNLTARNFLCVMLNLNWLFDHKDNPD